MTRSSIARQLRKMKAKLEGLVLHLEDDGKYSVTITFDRGVLSLPLLKDYFKKKEHALAYYKEATKLKSVKKAVIKDHILNEITECYERKN